MHRFSKRILWMPMAICCKGSDTRMFFLFFDHVCDVCMTSIVLFFPLTFPFISIHFHSFPFIYSYFVKQQPGQISNVGGV